MPEMERAAVKVGEQIDMNRKNQLRHTSHVDYRTGDLGGYVFYFGTLPEDMCTVVQYEPLEAKQIFWWLSRQKGAHVKKYDKYTYLVTVPKQITILNNYFSTLSALSGLSGTQRFYVDRNGDVDYGWTPGELDSARRAAFRALDEKVDEFLADYDVVGQADCEAAADYAIRAMFNGRVHYAVVEELAAEYADEGQQHSDYEYGYGYTPGEYGQLYRLWPFVDNLIKKVSEAIEHDVKNGELELARRRDWQEVYDAANWYVCQAIGHEDWYYCGTENRPPYVNRMVEFVWNGVMEIV